MTESPTPAQPDFIHPELDGLEVYLASHPDVLKGLMDVPFGEILNKIADLGFDKDILKEEIASTDLFTSSIWLEPVGIDSLDDFWLITPLQYCEQWPDIGAALVAGVIKSIHVSDEQAALLSSAGGKTNLTKSEKWEIAGGAVLLGYVLPRVVSIVKASRSIEKEEVERLAALERNDPDFHPFEKIDGFEYRPKFSYSQILGGTRFVSAEAKTLGGRIYFELGNTLPGKLAHYVKIKLQERSLSRARRLEGIEIESEVQSFGERTSTELAGSLVIQEDVDRNIVEAEIRPGREAERIARFVRDRLPENPIVDGEGLSDDVRSELNVLQKDLAQSIAADFDESLENSFVVVEVGGNRIEDLEKRELMGIVSEEESSLEDKLSVDAEQLENEAESQFERDVDTFAQDAVANLENAVVAQVDESVEVAESKAENIISDAL
jgi:hypothetical protein